MATPSTTTDSRNDDRIVQLVRQYQEPLRTHLACLGCPADRIDDFLQETFLRILDSAFTDRHPAATFSWLRTVANNLYLNAIRRDRRHVELPDLDAIESSWREFEGDDGGETWLRALGDCFEELTEKTQSVLRGHYAGGRSRAAIAADIGITEVGVKSILHRARQTLRTCIERRMR